MKQAIQVVLWGASCVGIFCIFGDGIGYKIIGVLSVLWMAFSTIATAIDETRQEKKVYEAQDSNNPYRLALLNGNSKYMDKE